RAEAAQEGERVRKETQLEIAKIQEHAGQEVNSTLKAAQIELKRYSGQLAVNLARQKVGERMTPAAQNALVEDFVAGMGEPPPPAPPRIRYSPPQPLPPHHNPRHP